MVETNDTEMLSFDKVLKLLSFWGDDNITQENIDKLLYFANHYTDNKKYEGRIIDATLSCLLRSLLRAKEFPDEDAAKLFLLIFAKCSENIYRIKGECYLMHYAIIGDRHQIFDILLAKGFDPNGQDNFKMTPMHWAIKLNRVWHVNKLLETQKINLNIRDRKDRTPLDLILINNKTDPEIIEAIKQYLNDTKQDSIVDNKNIIFHHKKILQQKQPTYTSVEQIPLLSPAAAEDDNTNIHKRRGHTHITEKDAASRDPYKNVTKQANITPKSIMSYIKGWWVG